jgi:hypothetical protein
MPWRAQELRLPLPPALGKNCVEVSAGRQAILLGDGFLVAGDGISASRGIAGNRYNRAGTISNLPD